MATENSSYIDSYSYKNDFSGSAARRLEEPARMPVERPRRQTRQKQPKSFLSIKNVLCIAAVAFAFVMLLTAQLKLYRTAEEITALKSEISEAETKRDMLRASYDSAIDYRAMEEKAMLELGMSKPASGQVVYINLAGADRGEVLDGKGESIFEELGNIIDEAFENLGTYLTGAAS